MKVAPPGSAFAWMPRKPGPFRWVIDKIHIARPRGKVRYNKYNGLIADSVLAFSPRPIPAEVGP